MLIPSRKQFDSPTAQITGQTPERLFLTLQESERGLRDGVVVQGFENA
jgi:hypothetical protein